MGAGLEWQSALVRPPRDSRMKAGLPGSRTLSCYSAGTVSRYNARPAPVSGPDPEGCRVVPVPQRARRQSGRHDGKAAYRVVAADGSADLRSRGGIRDGRLAGWLADLL